MVKNIRTILELLENEQIDVNEAESAIRSLFDGRFPDLPELAGKYAICEKCGTRMLEHSSSDACPYRKAN